MNSELSDTDEISKLITSKCEKIASELDLAQIVELTIAMVPTDAQILALMASGDENAAKLYKTLAIIGNLVVLQHKRKEKIVESN